MSQWSDHVIWWQVYPLGFVGADTTQNDHQTPVHRLDQLTAWLDDLINLGCNGLALGPIFDSETHGYDTTDFFRIDPRLGDDHDFDELVSACRQRGIRILLDGVFNHVGRSSALWQRAIADGPGSDAAVMFRLGADMAPEAFEGHDQLVVLNHADPAVADLIERVMRHWLDRGIDGWRLDAAYAVDPEFWRKTVEALRPDFPDAWFVGEVIHGDYLEYIEASGLDSLTQYELWKAIRSALQERNFFELDWTLRRHDALIERFLPMTFIGNHDVTRIASAIDDERHHAHAIALLFFLPGVPSVYYGDERGLTGVKEERLGGDDAIRPAFPEDPESSPPNAVYRTYQRWIALRRQHPWLTHAHVASEDLQNETVVLRATGRDGESARLGLNLSDTALRIDDVTVEPHDWEFID